jgi:hypothetical protein
MNDTDFLALSRGIAAANVPEASFKRAVKRPIDKAWDEFIASMKDRIPGLPDAFKFAWKSAPKREWVGLTEWEREAIALECGAMSADWLVFMEAVEKALEEKNT